MSTEPIASNKNLKSERRVNIMIMSTEEIRSVAKAFIKTYGKDVIRQSYELALSVGFDNVLNEEFKLEIPEVKHIDIRPFYEKILNCTKQIASYSPNNLFNLIKTIKLY